MFRFNAQNSERNRQRRCSFGPRFLLGCSALALMSSAPLAQAQISQSLNYSFSASEYDQSLSLDHSVNGIHVGILDFGFSQSTGYSLNTNSLNDYNAGIDINDDQNFFGNINGSLSDSYRTLGGFTDNQFETEWFSVAISASGDLEWSESTFEDEGYLDEDFDPSEYSEEELTAIVWSRSQMFNTNYTLEAGQYTLGRLKVRPLSQGAVSYADFNGTTYEVSGAVGLSLAPAEEDEFEDFFFEESNLSISVPGGAYGGGDGEVVIGVGYGSEGFAQIAALVFKRFDIGNRVSISFDALGSAAYEAEMPFAFDFGSFRVGADFQATDDLSLRASASIEVQDDLSQSYYATSGLSYNGFSNFSPSIRLSGNYRNGSGQISLPIGFSGSFSDNLRYSVDLSPSYSTEDQSMDVSVSGSLSLTGPAISEDGPTSNFSVSGDLDLISGSRSISVSGGLSF